ncbi:NADH-quinone oxidoreductase subunit B family protein [Roseomonas sp. BN140053]|uniref:NADH-quinone oxidoreductase subunit B family protein n=1 Tax=Roseomonas sp. BN140053 TaxID=3391898 RepID=UPI0039E8D86C
MLWTRLAQALLSRPLPNPAPEVPADAAAALAVRLAESARLRLGRSLAIREIDAGSCNGCELEIAALSGIAYDLERFGLRFVSSPRHADLLLVTGPVTRNMAEALRRAHACMPGHGGRPGSGWVVAAGDCAADGGCFRTSAAVEGGVGAVLPVDLVIPGCPPSPVQLLEGLLALLDAHSRADSTKAGAPDGRG